VAVGLALFRLAVLVPVLLLTAEHGIDSVAVAQAVVAFGLALVMETVAAGAVGVSMPTLARALVPAVVVGVCTAAGTALGRWVVPGPGAVRLLIGVAAGAGAAFAGLYISDRALIRQVAKLTRRRRS
jgi:hypothetical protein